MKNNDSLYFDIWRKRNFVELLMVYTQTANQFKKQDEMRIGFGEMLDKYVEGGKKKYTGTNKQWTSAYTLGLELGIFRRKTENGYELSKLANDFLKSKIVGSEYLLNYLLNLNQLIDGKIVHPLYQVLKVIKQNNGYISKSEVIKIDEFKLYNKKLQNQRQLVNILFHRMVEAKILDLTSNKDVYREKGKYPVDLLVENCNIYERSVNEFKEMSHQEYVDMLSNPSPLIKVYRNQGSEENE
ncbi:hypothetical protein FB545_0714 [Peribacillus frigoritolerans]|uniref:hypothetical protein n=1 Tax=Peribacillus frigoritolerans TaxID=450367 RepID=UPI00119B8293|nr:hypothetical protein [Peribacillus frigoritolerans]TWE03638.1 hypothetical protein FB545_0714 [Peribacillus frigoritolerans]